MYYWSEQSDPTVVCQEVSFFKFKGRSKQNGEVVNGSVAGAAGDMPP